jgi:starch-binding outer membrane protein, SusD/RagB family
MVPENRPIARNWLRSGLMLGLVALVPLLAACDLDDILAARDPFTVTPETARDTANLQFVYAGARSQFALAYAGLQNREGGVIMMSALASDEMFSSDNFSTRRAVDRRQFDYDNPVSAADHAFVYLQRARAEALNATELFAGSTGAGSARHAELFSIAGYSVIMLAENFCAGIPLSRITETAVVFGEPMMAPELYNLAVSYFDQAIAMTGAGAIQHNLARIGKARALLNLDQHTQAAQVASQVPNAFDAFDIEYAAGSFHTPNAVFNMNNEERRFSVASSKGTINRGLPYLERSQAGDPRVPIEPESAPGSNGEVEAWFQAKYPSLSAPVPLATGVEARLIEAEALLQKGASAGYLPILNSLRAEIGLPALSDPGTAGGRIDQFFEERAYWLWLTGQRFSDMRRLVRQYNMSPENVFPTGQTPYGETIGSNLSFPIPIEEVNNPQYTGCTVVGA